MKNENFISPKETAEYLGIGMNSIYRLLNEDNAFPAIHIGHRWFIKKDMIDYWIERKFEDKKS